MSENEIDESQISEPEALDQQPSDETARESAGRVEPEVEVDPEEIVRVASEFVSGLLEAMGLEGEVAGEVEEGRANLNVTGPDLGVLIGRRGQTLDALQEVTRTAVQRRLESRVRLLVDVEGYRARRRSSLADYAIQMAERAMERGTEIELEPMNSYERKICHDAIATVEGASSFSEGEEPNRKVIIRGE